MARSPRTDSLTVDEIAQRMRGVFARYAIERAILFGSFARGRQSKRSDVDLILIQKTDKPYFERFEGILRDLNRAVSGRDIEVFIYTPDELEQMKGLKFIERALREGRVLYES
jgi:predicted nucleotidyltransferase